MDVRVGRPVTVNAREMDDLLGTNGRLAIVATLAQVDFLTFTELGLETGLADGNLHVQTRKLLAAGYLSRQAERRGGRKVTCFALTTLGRERFTEHVGRLAGASGHRLRVSGSGAMNGRRGRGTGPGKDDSQVW